jgi:hypothetical protein
MAKSARTKKSGKDVLERRRAKREKTTGMKRLRKAQRVG